MPEVQRRESRGIRMKRVLLASSVMLVSLGCSAFAMRMGQVPLAASQAQAYWSHSPVSLHRWH